MLRKDHKSLLNYWINPSRITTAKTPDHGINRDSEKNRNSYSYIRTTDAKDGQSNTNKRTHVVLKNLLRSEYRQKRNNLSAASVSSKSRAITKILLENESITKALTYGLYFPVNNEVDTRFIFEYIRSCDKKAYFPRVYDHGLEFHKVGRLDKLGAGNFGVPEPPAESEKIDIKDLDIVLVPGIVYDRKGYRIGYGKGFYDRTLEGADVSRLFGLCYGFQLIHELPVDKYDKSVGAVVTENGLINCKKERR